MKNRARIIGSTVALGMLLTVSLPSAHAVLFTDQSAVVTPTVVDFNQFSGSFTITGGPIQVGVPTASDVTFTSSHSIAVIGSEDYGLGSNGRWHVDKTGFVGINSDVDSITLTLNDGPVATIGAFVNYVPDEGGGTPIISVLGAGDVVLESYDLSVFAPISTLGEFNAGAFRGIARPTADITAFRISGAEIVADDLRYSTQVAVLAPEGGTLALALPGIGLVAAFAVRRRKK